MGLYRFSSPRGAHGERLLRRYPPDPPPPPPVAATCERGSRIPRPRPTPGTAGGTAHPNGALSPGPEAGTATNFGASGSAAGYTDRRAEGAADTAAVPPWGCSHALNARPPLTVVLLAGHVGGGVAGDVEGDEHLALLAVPLQLAVVGAEEEEGREAGSGGGRPSRRQQGSQRGQQAGPAPGDAPPPLHAAAAGAAGASRARRDRRAAPLLSAPRGTGRDETRRDGARGGTDGAGRGGRCPPRSPRKFGERGAARRGAERSEVRATAALPRPQKAALPRAAPPSPSTAAGVRGSEPGARGLGIIYFPRCRGGREGKVPPPPPPLSPPPSAPPAPPAPRSARPGAVLPLRGGGLPARRCRCPLSAAGPCLRVPAPAPAPGAAPWSLALLLQPALP